MALWHGDRLLLIRTSYRSCYTLPGGFVRRRESSEQAARRELREELGIDLSDYPLRLVWSGVLTFESRRDAVDIWETTLNYVPPLHITGHEVTWAGWLRREEALEQPLLPHVTAYLAERR